MLLRNKQCADAGTENCPCRLAEYGKCIVCGRLNGSGNCDCEWQGRCIYNEYLQNNRCIKRQRFSGTYRIEKITWYEEDLVVMRLAVPRGMAEKAVLPGSFVFIKAPCEEDYFYTPVSVMRSSYEYGYIDLALKISGVKTQNLRDTISAFPEMNAAVEMRGIYENGLLGKEKLLERSERSGRKVLCLAKGMGLAPLVNYARWAKGRDSVDFIIDLEKISRGFAEMCLQDCDAAFVEYRKLPADIPWMQQEKYDVIIIGASDYYQQNIYVPESKRVITNNHSMCCGEGVCGACICTDANGLAHRMCKECLQEICR